MMKNVSMNMIKFFICFQLKAIDLVKLSVQGGDCLPFREKTVRNNLSRIIMWMAIIALFGACSKKGSVNELYKFPSTKDVRVHVRVDFKENASAGPAVSLVGHKFFLNAFLFSESEKQVQIGYADGSAPVDDLPVTLTSTSLGFDAIIRVPLETVPGPNGYAIHFVLSEGQTALGLRDIVKLRSTKDLKVMLEKTASMVFGENFGTKFVQDVTTVNNLEALKGSVQPGTSANANLVPLSLASTLAYRLTREVGVNNGSAVHVDAYESIRNTLALRIIDLEGKLDSTKTPDLSTFVSAMTSALKLQIAIDNSLQRQLVNALTPAAKAVFGDGQSSSLLAERFTASLKTFVLESSLVLSNSSRPEVALFNEGTIDPAEIPNPNTYVSVVFAPKGVTFTDSDTSSALGGTLAIIAPEVTDGIESYNVYFGGQTADASRIGLIGNIGASANPLSVAISTGTIIPAGAELFWVYPVVRGKELSLAASLKIINALATSVPTPTLTASVISSTEVALTWTNVPSGALVLVYNEGANAPTSCATGSAVANTFPYQVTNLIPSTTYRFALCNSISSTPIVTADAVATLPNVQTESEVSLENPAGGLSSDRFGSGIAVFGGKALIGSPTNDGNDDGKVFAFELTNGSWMLQETLENPEGNPTSNFGGSVAMTSSRAAIGEVGSSSVYYYEYDSSNRSWGFQHKFSADGDFGDKVAIDNELVVIGKPARSGTPFVQVHRGSGTTWNQVIQIDGPGDAEFGESIALTPTHLIVGGTSESGTGRPAGVVYSYTRASNFTDAFEIEHPTQFHGHAVAASGNTLVVGDPFDANAGVWSGEVRVYGLDGANTWTLRQTISGSGEMRFGMAVAIQGDRLFIGAPGDEGGEGKVYVYRRSGGMFNQTDTIRVPNAGPSNGSGASLSLNGNTLLIGTYSSEYSGFGPNGVCKAGLIDTLTLD
ncbi:MAG: hypothetical protein EOP06_00610 [Proteobacteria bacterium]|nr:MAG: hypothetical protein EOP06_00610 [Pseudomonadota bacterium]